MENARTVTRRAVCEFIACAVASLLFFQGFLAAHSLAGRHHLMSGRDVVAITAVEGLCHAFNDDAPADEPHRHQHCQLCAINGTRDLSLYAISFTAIAFCLLSVRTGAGSPLPRWGENRTKKPPPIGWIASWSSRAPPFVS